MNGNKKESLSMKFKDLVNGMVFQFVFDQKGGGNCWYTKLDRLSVRCVMNDNELAIGGIYFIHSVLLNDEVVIATNFS
jgi:hypothetical protein